MILRPFILYSEPLIYSAGLADVVFSQRSQGRAAITRISVEAANPEAHHRNLVNRFNIEGRALFAGDPVPIGLFSDGPAPLYGSQPQPQCAPRAIAPGPLPAPFGDSSAGIILPPRALPQMRLEDIEGSSPIGRVILHCVEFPADGRHQHAADALWQRFEAGEGQISYHGHRLTLTALGQHILAGEHHGPGPGTRHYAHGVAIREDDQTNAEAGFRALNARVYSATQSAPMEARAPARQVLGYPGAPQFTAQTELRMHEEALIEVEAPATPSPAIEFFALQVFAGRDPGAPITRNASQI
jgi:hypothetical protein